MKHLKRVFYDGFAFTVLVMFVYFVTLNIIAGSVNKNNLVQIDIFDFLLLLLFGFLISVANFIYRTMSWNKGAKILIHYCMTLLGFCAAFLPKANKSQTGNIAAYIFAVLIIFTLFYLVGVGVFFLAKYLLSDKTATKGRGKNAMNSNKNAAVKGAKAKTTSKVDNKKKNSNDGEGYKPRFK